MVTEINLFVLLSRCGCGACYKFVLNLMILGLNSVDSTPPVYHIPLQLYGFEGGFMLLVQFISLYLYTLHFCQFEIHDVHIRYEDDKTLLPQKYACGISIKHLIAKSTDENWVCSLIFLGNKRKITLYILF